MLDQIVADVRARLPGVIALEPELRRAAEWAPPPRPFAAALAGPGLSVIAEVKRRSPSKGSLASGLDPGSVARAYTSGGAAAISVLTEPAHFDGHPEDLRAVRDAVQVPVLRKDFVLHTAQVWESRAIGADALLLIVALLDDPTLRTLLSECEQAGLEALVEVHDEAEAGRAIDAGARVMGVNNRDLQNFAVDLGVAESLAQYLEGADCRIAESGIGGPADAARMAAAGYHAVLVGESLVRSGDPAAAVAQLVTAGQPTGFRP